MLTAMQDQQLMINLANQVYPVYEDIATKYGDKVLNQHLSYLGKHIGNSRWGCFNSLFEEGCKKSLSAVS